MVGISEYSVFKNSPILLFDPFGDTLGGVDARSANRELDIIQSSFPGSDASQLRGLFKIADNGMDFSKINDKDFVNSIKGLSEDEQALAYGYYSLINSNTRNTVEVVTRDERYSPQAASTILFMPNTWTEHNWPTATGKDVDFAGGGGMDWGVLDKNRSITGTFTIFTMDSKALTTDYQTSQMANNGVSQISILGETSAHEAIGHGLGRFNDPQTWRHEDAIQMSNLYRRINVSAPSNIDWRNGTNHYSNVAIPYDKANDIPSYMKEGLFKLKLGQVLLGNVFYNSTTR